MLLIVEIHVLALGQLAFPTWLSYQPDRRSRIIAVSELGLGDGFLRLKNSRHGGTIHTTLAVV